METENYNIKIIENIGLDDLHYYEDNGFISNSMMSDFETCPNLYRDIYIDHTYKKDLDSDSITIGKAVDKILTESDKAFDTNFQICNKKDWDGTREQITPAVGDKVMAMVKSMRRQNIWKKVFEGKGTKQEPYALLIEVEDKITKRKFVVKVKAKLDHLDKENKIIMDLKTCQNLFILKEKVEKKYYGQIAWYIGLTALITETKFSEWDGYVAGIETTGIYNSEFYVLDKSKLERSFDDKIRTLATIMSCIDEKNWSHEFKDQEDFRCYAYENCESNNQNKFIKI